MKFVLTKKSHKMESEKRKTTKSYYETIFVFPQNFQKGVFSHPPKNASTTYLYKYLFSENTPTE